MDEAPQKITVDWSELGPAPAGQQTIKSSATPDLRWLWWSMPLVLLVVIIWVALPGHSSKSAIRQVIERDHQASADLLKHLEQLSLAAKLFDASPAFGQYAKQLLEIDTSACPADFRAAWLRHAQAWTAYHSQMKRYSGFSGFMRGFLMGITAVRSGMTAEDDAERAIEESWYEVQRVALAHQVSVGID